LPDSSRRTLEQCVSISPRQKAIQRAQECRCKLPVHSQSLAKRVRESEASSVRRQIGVSRTRTTFTKKGQFRNTEFGEATRIFQAVPVEIRQKLTGHTSPEMNVQYNRVPLTVKGMPYPSGAAVPRSWEKELLTRLANRL